MKRVFWLLALLGAVLLSAAPVPADDGFYVIAGRYTPGTKITNLPYNITAPGYYYLTGNLSTSGTYGITINTGVNNVSIDLMGFCLTGPGGSSDSYGIYWAGCKNIEVRNGTVRGWYFGVVENSLSGSNHRIIGIRGDGNYCTVALGGNSHLIKGCTSFPSTGGAGWSYGLYILGNGGCISGCTVGNYTSSNFIGIFITGGGTITGNTVTGCTGTSAKGIVANGPATISYNQVGNCTTGISGAGGGSVIGNAVLANSGQTCVIINNANTFDQDSFSGAGSHYNIASGATTWCWALVGY